MIDRLLAMLAARGLSVVLSDKPGELRLVGPATERTPAIMDALREFKPQLLERLVNPPLISNGELMRRSDVNVAKPVEALYVHASSDPAAVGGKWVGNVWHPPIKS